MSGFPRIGEQVVLGRGGIGKLSVVGSYSRKILSFSPVAYWKLNELSGLRVKNYAPPVNIANAECIVNTGFEYAGSGTTFASWKDRVGTGAIADEGVVVHSGSHAAKITRGADNSTWIYQYIAVEPGQTYDLSMWCRGDGTVGGRYAVYDYTNSAFIKSFTATGVTGAAYAEVTDTFTTPATCGMVILYLACPTAAGDCYFDDISITGLSTLDGWLPAAGITYNIDGIGDGLSALRFGGAGPYVRIGTQAFNSVFNGNVGWAITWWRINAAGVWSDATARYPLHIRSGYDVTYYLTMGRPAAADDNWGWRRRAGGDSNEKLYDFGVGPLTWCGSGLVWDRPNNDYGCYLYNNGVVTEVFRGAPTDIPDFSAQSVLGGQTVLACGEVTAAQVWQGDIAHTAVGAGEALSASDMERALVP